MKPHHANIQAISYMLTPRDKKAFKDSWGWLIIFPWSSKIQQKLLRRCESLRGRTPIGIGRLSIMKLSIKWKEYYNQNDSLHFTMWKNQSLCKRMRVRVDWVLRWIKKVNLWLMLQGQWPLHKEITQSPRNNYWLYCLGVTYFIITCMARKWTIKSH